MRIGLAIKMASPLSAIALIKASDVSTHERTKLFKRVFKSVLPHSKGKNSKTAEALLELFWQFWSFDDLDQALLCLKTLLGCELGQDQAYKLDLAVALFGEKIRFAQDLQICSQAP